MQTIQLADFLKHRYGCVSEPIAEESVHRINQDRRREMRMRQVLHPGIVRRLDAGFARSNTVHPDTGYALYAICYASSAQNVFETGTYWGFSTTYLAAALKDKGAGKVYTFDIYEKAGKHIPPNLMPHIVLHRGKSSLEMMPAVLEKVVPDIFFQDSRHDYEGVRGELELAVPYLPDEGVVLFHDFVEVEVRRAAMDVLKDYTFYCIESDDPQQLGVALKK